MKRLLKPIIYLALSFLVFFIPNKSTANVLLDDFSSTYLSGGKWIEREFVREVSGGKLIVKHGNGGGWGEFRNNVSLIDAATISSLKATITLNDLVLETGNNPRSFIRLSGYFYNALPGGGGAGDIWANILIGDRGTGQVEVFWYVLQFDDDDKTSATTIGNGTLIGPLPYSSLPLTVTVGIDYNGSNQFTFTADSTSQSLTGPAYVRPPADTFKGIQAGIDCNNGNEIGYVSAEIDDFFINNETTAFDTFDGPTLDRTKWNELEFVREIASGELRLNVQADGSRTDATLRPGNQATDFFQTTVMVETGSYVTPDVYAIARIAGYYYNELRGPGSGLPYIGNTDDVWVDNRIVLNDLGELSAECSIWRHNEADPWGDATQLFYEVYNTSISFDTAYTLSIEYTGTQIIFSLDGESYTFDILTPTYLPFEGRSRQLKSRVYAIPDETGHMKVRFDDVYTSDDDYMIYAEYDPPDVTDVISVGGYVEDYGVPTTWGDEIQYIYFLSGTVGYKVRTWLTDSTDLSDPTPYIEPRQHPDHPRFPGPIEPRHFEIVSSMDLTEEAPEVGWSEAHKKEFHVDSTGVYVGAWLSGIHKFDHDWNYIGQISLTTPEESESLAYDPVANTWYAGGRWRKVYKLEDTDGDNDFMDEFWQEIFSYPSYAGGHHDGLEFAAGYLWVSDMTSDMIGQWQIDPGTGLWTELDIYTYSSPAHVEGMGFGPNNHFWIGSGWGPDAYLYELGNDITTKYPVAVAGEDVADHSPLIEIEFDGSGSYHQNPSRSIVLYEWDFDGDGTFDYSGTDPITANAYPAVYHSDGSINWNATVKDYVAILRVTDDTPTVDGGPFTHTDARIIHITAPPWKPLADPNGPYNVRVNQTLDLDGSGSYDPESQMYPVGHPWYETIALWEWDLDNDGEFDDATGETVQWLWPNEGTYFVCLRVTDEDPSGPGGTYGDMDMDTKCTVVLVSSIHDVAVDNVSASSSKVVIGDEVIIDSLLSNVGDHMEDVDVNCTYNGTLIDSTSVVELLPQDSQDIQFYWDTTGMSEGLFTIKVCAEAVPGEIIVDNNCAEVSVELSHVIPVAFDIKPESCPNPINTKRKGELPVAILGSADFDVATIDPATIILFREGGPGGEVSPLLWSYEDVATPYEGELCGCHDLNGDGYVDMTLKFISQEVAINLGLKDLKGQTVPLKITGQLFEADGAGPIVGQDCVFILK